MEIYLLKCDKDIRMKIVMSSIERRPNECDITRRCDKKKYSIENNWSLIKTILAMIVKRLFYLIIEYS